MIVSFGLLGCGDQPADGSDGAVLLIALSKQLREREVGELGELVREGFGDSLGDGTGVSMGATERFRNHFINNVEIDEIFRRHLQGGGGIRNFCWIVPQDSGAAFPSPTFTSSMANRIRPGSTSSCSSRRPLSANNLRPM